MHADMTAYDRVVRSERIHHLEQLTHTTGGGILLTASTRMGLGDGIVLEPRSDLRLGEPERALAVYRLIGFPGSLAGVSS